VTTVLKTSSEESVVDGSCGIGLDTGTETVVKGFEVVILRRTLVIRCLIAVIFTPILRRRSVYSNSTKESVSILAANLLNAMKGFLTTTLLAALLI